MLPGLRTESNVTSMDGTSPDGAGALTVTPTPAGVLKDWGGAGGGWGGGGEQEMTPEAEGVLNGRPLTSPRTRREILWNWLSFNDEGMYQAKR